MINKFAALLLIGMASPYQILDWYGGRHTCHTAYGAPGRLLAADVDGSVHFLRRQSVNKPINVDQSQSKIQKHFCERTRILKTGQYLGRCGDLL